MPEGKGTYGRRLGRPKKKRPMSGATKRPMRAAKRGVATGAGRAARGVAGAAMGIAGKAIKRKPAPRYAKTIAKRAGYRTVGSMMKKRKKARTTKRSSYL